MKIAKMALRNLNRHKLRTFLLGGAVAFGMMIITIITGSSVGLKNNMEKNFAYLMAGHIFIQGYEKSATGRRINIIHNDKAIIQSLIQGNFPIEQIIKRSTFRGTLMFNGMKIMQKVDGINWDEETGLLRRISMIETIEGYKQNPQAIILSKRMAEKLKANPGDIIMVQLWTATGQQNIGEFHIGGIFMDPTMFGNLSAYANYKYVNELLNIAPREYNSLCLFLNDISQIDIQTNKIYEQLKQNVNLFPQYNIVTEQKQRREMFKQNWSGTKYSVVTLGDILEPIEQFTNALNMVALGVLSILTVIIMIGIINTYRMVVYERVREIGTMRALGMQRRQVKLLFIMEAVFLSTGGALLGLFLGFIFTGIISQSKLIQESSPWYFITNNGYLTFFIPLGRILINVLLITLLSFIAVLNPASKAAKLKPANALRKIY